MAQRICVTGASGQAARVVADLRAHGYRVTPVDVAVTRADRRDGMLQADLTDYGQAAEALSGADAVVHLANIPAPGLNTPAVTFNRDITMNFNVFQAAASLKLSRVVWASSETALGLPFDTPAPVRAGRRGPLPGAEQHLRAVQGGPARPWLAIDRARDVLGFRPAHSWRDHVSPHATA